MTHRGFLGSYLQPLQHYTAVRAQFVLEAPSYATCHPFSGHCSSCRILLFTLCKRTAIAEEDQAQNKKKISIVLVMLIAKV